MSGRERIVIVGGGPAAHATAAAYRAAGGDGAVTILAGEPHPPYRRPPLTKEFLQGRCAREDLPIAHAAFHGELDIDLRMGAVAEKLDLDASEVVAEGGERHPFDRVVLATGARPLLPDVPGVDHARVRTVRRIEDAERLRDDIEPGDPVVVVGSGFIGCEAASSLASLGARVTILTAEDGPQIDRLGDQASRAIGGWLNADGVSVRTGAKLTAVRPLGADSVSVEGEGEFEVTASLVLIALGVVRNDEIAGSAGLPTDDGLEVDSRMVSSDERVLAAGDVAHAFNSAAGRRLRVEHWGEALNMGEVAGRTLAGKQATWNRAPGFWSTVGGRTLKYAGWGEGFDDVRWHRSESGSFVARYSADREAVGVLAHLDDEAYAGGRMLIEQRRSWPWRGARH